MARYLGRMTHEDPDDRRGRELARESIAAALYGTDRQEAGFIPGVLEAVDSARNGDQLGVLLGMMAELWVWAQVGTQLVADALDQSVEEAFALMVEAIDTAGPDA